MQRFQSLCNYIIIMACVILSACTTTQNKADFDNAISCYYGMKVDKLVEVWGAPQASFVNQDKSNVYQWLQPGGSYHFPGASYPWIGGQSNAYAPWNHALWPAWHGGVYSPGISMFVSRPMTLDRSCTLNIFTDSQNIVTGHKAEGVGCISE